MQGYDKPKPSDFYRKLQLANGEIVGIKPILYQEYKMVRGRRRRYIAGELPNGNLVLNADKSEVLPYKMIGIADWSYNK
tara:strand:+ start:3474 stop:3710 length:237 start_codon:yes stop_codon:yes gene_type:complete